MHHPLRALRRWLNVKTWDKTHVPIPPIEEWKFDPEWNFCASPEDIAWLLKPSDTWTPTKEEIEEAERQWDLPLDVIKEYKPIPPKSALWRPPNLEVDEKLAVELVEMFRQTEKHLVKGSGFTIPKLKPALKKRVADVQRGYRRVWFDDKGKMHEVKEEAA